MTKGDEVTQPPVQLIVSHSVMTLSVHHRKPKLSAEQLTRASKGMPEL